MQSGVGALVGRKQGGSIVNCHVVGGVVVGAKDYAGAGGLVGYHATGSRKGYHTEYLGYILAEMQYLPRAYPDAKW